MIQAKETEHRRPTVGRGGAQVWDGNWLAWQEKSPTSVTVTTMLTFESLPVELISDILGETNIESLIGASSAV